jgi:hypothetical protein
VKPETRVRFPLSRHSATRDGGFTRSIDNQALTMQCSKSAVESNWKNQSQEERRSGKRKSFQWEAPKKIPAEEMGITNRQLLSAFIRHPNEARPGSHPITT